MAISHLNHMFCFLTTDREDPFLLPEVLRYLALPDRTKWQCPADLHTVMGLINLARHMGAKYLLQDLSTVLEIPLEKLRQGGKKLNQLVRSQLRYVRM